MGTISAVQLLIGCAMEKEVAILQQSLPFRCQYLVTGMGIPRTGAVLSDFFHSRKPSLLIFTGTAGQLDPKLEMGEVVFPEAWHFQDGSCFWSDLPLVASLRQSGWLISGRGLTVIRPVVRRQARLDLHRKFGASVCDMEAAAALKTASAFGVPCLALKVISDTSSSALVSFWTHFHTNMLKLSECLKRLIPVLASGAEQTNKRTDE